LRQPSTRRPRPEGRKLCADGVILDRGELGEELRVLVWQFKMFVVEVDAA
jgi:hypothetical protein